MPGSSSDPTNPPNSGGPAPGDIIAGKYVVESLLGVGGMGLVVSARHIQLNQTVAIKLLRSGPEGTSSASRFLREARAAASIRCEHVARVLDVGTLESGLPYIVMERLTGADLAAHIEARGKLPPGEAVSLVLQACEAIGEAHALGIVHRDLKPSNVFVTTRADGSPLVKVLDFGISKMQDPLAFTGADATLTASGSVLGSPAYMSPEQIRSARGTDARSDVWAMGVILYELVTGRNPFIGETLGDTLVKIASESPVPLRDIAPEVPEALAEVIGRCLVRDPANRTRSIAELAQGLLPFAAQDMSAFVERIARVAAAMSPLAVTGLDAERSEPMVTLRQDSQGTEQSWQGALSAPRTRARGGVWRWTAGLTAVGGVIAAAWLAREGRPVGAHRDATVEAGAMRPDERATGPAPTPAPDLIALTVVNADAGTVSSVDASVSPTHGPEHRKGHHPASGETAGTPSPSASSPAAAPSARSLDELLEGRH